MVATANPLRADQYYVSPKDYKGLNFALYRQAIHTNVPIRTFATDPTPVELTKEDAITAMSAPTNIDTLTQLIISRNSIGLPVDPTAVGTKVKALITAWIGMGKFNNLRVFTSYQHMVEHFNGEFVREFADIALPTDVMKVQSVTNPNGMFVQQSRTLSFPAKRPPFWERALYKRLEDRVRDIPMDESEGPFYKFELTGKKMPEPIKLGDIFEREAPKVRMIPQYEESHNAGFLI